MTIAPLFLLFAAIIAMGIYPGSKGKFNVKQEGALKNIMDKGDISTQADLGKLRKKKHPYAIGAVENLKEEILILDVKPQDNQLPGRLDGITLGKSMVVKLPKTSK